MNQVFIDGTRVSACALFGSGELQDVDDTGDLTRFTEYNREMETLKIKFRSRNWIISARRTTGCGASATKRTTRSMTLRRANTATTPPACSTPQRWGCPIGFLTSTAPAADSFQVAVASEGDLHRNHRLFRLRGGDEGGQGLPGVWRLSGSLSDV